MERNIYTKPTAPCHCLNLRRASQALTEIYDEYLGSSGLKISQFALLGHIYKLGPINGSDLASQMRLDRTTLVRNLKIVAEKGWITDQAEKGTRDRQLVLTATGVEVLKKGERLWQEAQNFIAQYLGQDDLTTLTGLISKIEALVP